MKNPNLIGKLRAQLPTDTRSLLDTLLGLAEKRSLPLYLVGGPLRDLLLDRPSLDLDIAVEGDAMALAHEVAIDAGSSRAEALPSVHAERVEAAAATTLEPRVTTHPTFLTATVRTPGFHLDLITTRSETYARPGALPTVKPATIREDLRRRDFTINALALRLTGPAIGESLDPVGGQSDLDAKLIRVLHDRSFQDDATRILRAFRYAARLGFDIEPETLAWLKRDLPYLKRISATRIHHEFVRIFAEDAPEETFRCLDETGALAAIHPALRFDREHAEAFARLRDLNPTAARAAYWPALAWRLTGPQAADLARRLAITRPQRVAFEAMPAFADLVPRRDAPKARLGTGPGELPAKRSALAELLAPFPLSALWALAALTDDHTVRDRLLDYLTKARTEKSILSGDELLKLGLLEGEDVGEFLRYLRNARLDGEMRTREDEMNAFRDLMRLGGT